MNYSDFKCKACGGNRIIYRQDTDNPYDHYACPCKRTVTDIRVEGHKDMEIQDEINRLDKFDKLVLINRIIQLEALSKNKDTEVLDEIKRLIINNCIMLDSTDDEVCLSLISGEITKAIERSEV